MGTITEELFRRRLGHDVHAGDTVIAEVDVAMAHDVTGPLAIEAFRSLDLPLWDASRIVFNFDHVMPAQHCCRGGVASGHPRVLRRAHDH